MEVSGVRDSFVKRYSLVCFFTVLDKFTSLFYNVTSWNVRM